MSLPVRAENQALLGGARIRVNIAWRISTLILALRICRTRNCPIFYATALEYDKKGLHVAQHIPKYEYVLTGTNVPAQPKGMKYDF